MKNPTLKNTVLILMFLTFTLPAFADPNDPPADEDPVEGAPIEDWVPFLAVAGIGLGLYFLNKNRQEATT